VALDDYYAALPVASFADFYPYSDLRDPLVEIGQPALLAIVDDLRSQQVSDDTKRKSLFALAAFNESGQSQCEGIVIPTLIALTESADAELAAWSDVALTEGFGESFDSPGEWRQWWESEGSERFTDTCSDTGTAG
jgi:hypothetical protein